DLSGGLFVLAGMLAALHERHRTGLGRWIDLSLTESAMAFLHPHLAAQLAAGEGPVKLRRGAGPLNGGYPCYGRYLSVAALEPKFWNALCVKLHRPDLIPDGWDTEDKGAKVRSELEAIFAG